MRTMSQNNQYVGRFAPSPSGPLHFGSLVTALGSFLRAKSQHGKWLLRIEDIDPPREVSGATDAILACLEAHHLYWDEEIVYQSARSDLYDEKIQWLSEQGFTYICQCTRAQLAKLQSGDVCHCATDIRSKTNGMGAIRFRYPEPDYQFNDELQGTVRFSAQSLPAQFAIKRKDGLYAYQLAVVVDDIQQGVTEVARGADLLEATLYQKALYQAFNCSAPKFLHFPVVVTEPGKKLSKQNHAKEVSANYASVNLIQALDFLGLSVPKDMHKEAPAVLLNWAIQVWDLTKLVAQPERIDNRIGYKDSI